jgi:hypothetical protein
MTLSDQLEALAKDATPGPVHVQDPLGDGPGDALWIVEDGASPEAYDWRCLAIFTSDDPEDNDCSSSAPIEVAERDANAALMVLLWNNRATIITALRKAGL